MSLNSVSSWWHNHRERRTVPSDLKRLMSLLWQSSQLSYHEIMNLIMRQHQTNGAVGDSLPGPPFEAHIRCSGNGALYPVTGPAPGTDAMCTSIALAQTGWILFVCQMNNESVSKFINKWEVFFNFWTLGLFKLKSQSKFVLQSLQTLLNN